MNHLTKMKNRRFKHILFFRGMGVVTCSVMRAVLTEGVELDVSSSAIDAADLMQAHLHLIASERLWVGDESPQIREKRWNISNSCWSRPLMITVFISFHFCFCCHMSFSSYLLFSLPYFSVLPSPSWLHVHKDRTCWIICVLTTLLCFNWSALVAKWFMNMPHYHNIPDLSLAGHLCCVSPTYTVYIYILRLCVSCIAVAVLLSCGHNTCSVS